MKRIKFVSLFVLLALLSSVIMSAVLADDPEPERPVATPQPEEDKVRPRRNGGIPPDYVPTKKELAALAAKEALLRQFIEEHKESPARTRSQKTLSVGVWREPDDLAHVNYCGPGSTQVALDARLYPWEIPDIDTIGEEENIDPDYGVWMTDVSNVLNTRLSTTWYSVSGASSADNLFWRIRLNINADYALVTACKTGGMSGWGDRNVEHIMAVYGYNDSASDWVYYTETSSPTAGYNGPYYKSTTHDTFWGYVVGNNTQAW